MPPLSATERQKLLLQQEIAKLSGKPGPSSKLTSGAISSRASGNGASSHPSSYHPYRGGYSYRGGRGKPRGRGKGGGGYSVDFRQGSRASGSSTPSASTTPAPTMLAGASSTAVEDTEMEEGEVSHSSTSMPVPSTASKPPSDSGAWVKKTSRGGNMSLMTVQKRNKLAAQPPKPRHPRVPASVQVLQSTSDTSPGGSEGQKRVVIDGVIFQFEQDGKKLTRIGELPSAKNNAAANDTPTRHTLNYQGENFRRTKRGNLISRSTASARRAEQAKRPCRYYTKTGRCERALTCPYQHIPDRLAICHQFLRGSCPLGDSCPLSHTPSAHNTPSCSRFQATSSCYKGDRCLYPHVRVADDAPVCEAFAREGWCDRPAGKCPELHIWECPEWHAKGTCSRGRKCGLRHVLRAEKTKTKTAPAPVAPPVAAEGAFDDQVEFIGLPGEVFSETESEEEEDDDDEEEEGSDEEDDDSDEEEDDEDDDEDSVEVDEDTGKEEVLPSPTEVASDEDDERLVLDQV